MKHAALLQLAAVLCATSFAFAQATHKPAGQKPAGQKPAPSSRKPAPTKPASVTKPAPDPPRPTDIRFTSRYTHGEQVTEGVTFLFGTRERYELGDMILLR